MCFGSRLKLFITVSCVCRPRAALLPLARPGDAAHGLPLSDRSTVGRTFGVTSLDQITASRQPSWLRSCGLSCHPDCCVMGPTLPREGSKASQSRRLGSASDPGNYWAAIPAVLLGLDCGYKPLVHVLDGATGESWHERYDGSCAPPGRPPLRQQRGARRPRSAPIGSSRRASRSVDGRLVLAKLLGGIGLFLGGVHGSGCVLGRAVHGVEDEGVGAGIAEVVQRTGGDGHQVAPGATRLV